MHMIPVKDLGTKTSRVLRTLPKHGATAVADAGGKTTAYLMEARAFEALQARVLLLEGIARGEQAIQQGRVLTQIEARKKMARWLKRK
ncbi:MAG TPA: type II toxin-antitoxin system prevent-host-death family antitoxin [Phycisphaerae bacterium]|nr:type II toxin-antitoxin system prevent-host-death family antitoxin [Phycisphaerae bacterium]